MPEIDYKDHIAFLKEIASRATQKEEDVRIKDMVTGEVRYTEKPGNTGSVSSGTYKSCEAGTTGGAAKIRTFETGATRDTDAGKHDYEGYLSPLVIERFGKYMTKHRIQTDGNVRDSDNWTKGIPKSEYLKSLWRHLVAVWKIHRGYGSRTGLEDALCGIIFNANGYLFEVLREQNTSQDFGKEPSLSSEKS